MSTMTRTKIITAEQLVGRRTRGFPAKVRFAGETYTAVVPTFRRDSLASVTLQRIDGGAIGGRVEEKVLTPTTGVEVES